MQRCGRPARLANATDPVAVSRNRPHFRIVACPPSARTTHSVERRSYSQRRRRGFGPDRLSPRKTGWGPSLPRYHKAGSARPGPSRRRQRRDSSKIMMAIEQAGRTNEVVKRSGDRRIKERQPKQGLKRLKMRLFIRRVHRSDNATIAASTQPRRCSVSSSLFASRLPHGERSPEPRAPSLV
jgi:hypothetical protein